MNMHDEFIDEELVAIGVKFTDETVPKEMPTMEYRDGSGSQKKPEQKRCEAVDAKYVPVPKGGTSWAPSPTERLKKCVRGVGPLAVICFASSVSGVAVSSAFCLITSLLLIFGVLSIPVKQLLSEKVVSKTNM